MEVIIEPNKENNNLYNLTVKIGDIILVDTKPGIFKWEYVPKTKKCYLLPSSKENNKILNHVFSNIYPCLGDNKTLFNAVYEKIEELSRLREELPLM